MSHTYKTTHSKAIQIFIYAHGCKSILKLLITLKLQVLLRMANAEEKQIDILKTYTGVTFVGFSIHMLVKFLPVLDLIVSLDTVCPIRSY